MTPADALAVVAHIKAIWPAMQLPDQSAKVWATELAAHDSGTAHEAVALLGRWEPRPPALAEVLGACEEMRREHQRKQPSLVDATSSMESGPFITFTDWRAQQPEEMQHRIANVSTKLAKKYGITPEHLDGTEA